MAHRRMFSPDIVSSEEFLSMPVSSRALYFHLGMNADDDGFIQPQITMRACSATEDDLRVLLTKRFLLPFESGVVVIKHWLIHNMIRLDRYKATRFQKEKNSLIIKENKAYTDRLTEWQPTGNQMVPQVRLGQGKDTREITHVLPSKAPEKTTEEELTIDENIDDEGNDRPSKQKKPKLPKKNKSIVALALQRKFSDLCRQNLSTSPMLDNKGYFSVLYAMNKGGLSEKQITELFEEWFMERRLPDEKIAQIGWALSSAQVTAYKARHQII